MNFRALLLAPLRCSHAAMRWVTLAVLALCIGGGIVFAIFTSKPNWLWGVMALYGAGIGYVWAFYLSSLVLLAIDARRLCLPGVQRTVEAAVLFYAALSVLPAAALCGLFGGDMLATALLLSLILLGGLSFALLPRYFAMVIGLLPALHSSFAETLPIPGPTDPRFLAWAPYAVAALALLSVLRWRRLLHSESTSTTGLSDAMVLQYRRSGWGNGWGSAGIDSTQQVRQRPDWMQPQVDLRHAGPERPATALRIALGNSYLPKTLMGHVRTLAPTLLMLLVPAAVIALVFNRSHLTSSGMLWSLAAVSLGWGCLYGSMGVAIGIVMPLTQRWRKANTELPLLALLPGLGNQAQAKRQLLRTSLLRPLLLQAVLCTLLLAAAIYMHVGASALLLIVMSGLGSALCLVACLLCVIGGRPLSGWALAGVMTALGVLIGGASYIPGSMISRQPWTPPALYTAVLLGLWVALAALLAWLLRRGWQGWRRRPHAFIPNA
ncbi:hypothetical protein [Dyella sp. C9]|uniref:hypothetical protein n=1 Tax=Dyella sp. C9 TaxID=2202154 RepID=UPI000DEF4A85|nr:hypothetical protein [Dyella sp. C9]